MKQITFRLLKVKRAGELWQLCGCVIKKLKACCGLRWKNLLNMACI